MATRVHYFFDTELGAFHKDDNVTDHGPTNVWNYQPERAEERHSLIGGEDGYIRRYDEQADTDDGTAIVSYVDIGPVAMGEYDSAEGLVLELHGVVPEQSGDIDWALYVADSFEQVVREATARSSGTWTGTGRQATERPRARGSALRVRLSNGQDLRWAMEPVEVIIKTTGRVKI